MRPCPFCAEEIQDAAIKCKHCGEMLNQPPVGQSTNPAKNMKRCRHCGAENDLANGECWQCKKTMAGGTAQTVGVLCLLIPAAFVLYFVVKAIGGGN